MSRETNRVHAARSPQPAAAASAPDRNAGEEPGAHRARRGQAGIELAVAAASHSRGVRRGGPAPPPRGRPALRPSARVPAGCSPLDAGDASSTWRRPAARRDCWPSSRCRAHEIPPPASPLPRRRAGPRQRRRRRSAARRRSARPGVACSPAAPTRSRRVRCGRRPVTPCFCRSSREVDVRTDSPRQCRRRRRHGRHRGRGRCVAVDAGDRTCRSCSSSSATRDRGWLRASSRLPPVGHGSDRGRGRVAQRRRDGGHPACSTGRRGERACTRSYTGFEGWKERTHDPSS